MPVTHKPGPGYDRIYVPAHEWGYSPGTDFMLNPSGDILADNDTGVFLSDGGWTTTAIALVAGAGADFNSSAGKGVPGHIITDAQHDTLISPAIFGDYQHMKQAEKILGYAPTSLNLEVLAAFSVANNNENISGFGFVEDGGDPGVANDHLAYIYSDGTNFKMRSGAATSAAGPVDGTAWTTWKITIISTVSWYVDGTLQNAIALEADEFPVSFGMNVDAANRVLLGHVHIWYE